MAAGRERAHLGHSSCQSYMQEVAHGIGGEVFAHHIAPATSSMDDHGDAIRTVKAGILPKADEVSVKTSR